MLRTDNEGYPRRTLMSMMHYFVFLLFFILSVIFLFHVPIFVSTRKLLFFGEQEFNVDWQRAAACLLVAIGSHDPDLVYLFSTLSLLFVETAIR